MSNIIRKRSDFRKLKFDRSQNVQCLGKDSSYYAVKDHYSFYGLLHTIKTLFVPVSFNLVQDIDKKEACGDYDHRRFCLVQLNTQMHNNYLSHTWYNLAV